LDEKSRIKLVEDIFKWPRKNQLYLTQALW
jgi:hypothetical protein